jgi:hypothetical protein
MALVAIGASLWLSAEMGQLRTELARTRAERQAWQQREQTLQQEIAQGRQRQNELTEELQHEQTERQRLEQQITEQQPARPSILAFVLSGLARDSSEPKKLVIPSGTDTVRLQVELEPGDEYASYQAIIQTMAGEELLNRSGLRARATKLGQTVSLPLPANRLSPGEYELTLRGVNADGQIEDVGFYYFNVTKQ